MIGLTPSMADLLASAPRKRNNPLDFDLLPDEVEDTSSTLPTHFLDTS